MSVTKNHQPRETLLALAADAFPGKAVSDIVELTEGMFNAAYRVNFSDGTASILKIAAADKSGLLSNEISLMQAEVAAMELARSHGLPYVPRVHYSDFSCTRCDGTFFFMEVMPGRSVNSCREEISEETFKDLMRETGWFQRQTAAICGEKFGLLGDENRFDTLHELLVYMFSHVLQDAAARQIDPGLDPERLMALLQKERSIFYKVEKPSLVHWDMWEGNIFVKDAKVSGIIDWERAMWADPFMDDRFRRHTRSQAFLEGFGQTDFSPEEKRRIRWYDLFLYITMYVECFYRQYADNTGFVNWIRQELDAAWMDIQDQYE